VKKSKSEKGSKTDLKKINIELIHVNAEVKSRLQEGGEANLDKTKIWGRWTSAFDEYRLHLRRPRASPE
jgi:hypothetical protein